MSYSFDIIGISPVLQFFDHQQRLEKNPSRSRAYLGSYCCTLDAFIEATQAVHRKPDWDWDAIVSSMVEFWLSRENDIRHWQHELKTANGDNNLVVGRVVNYHCLRHEFESLFEA